MAVVAALVGIMVLAAAAHYYYTTSYSNEEPMYEYHESYRPPEQYWHPPVQHEYNYEENSVDRQPDRVNIPETTSTVSTAPSVSAHTLQYEMKLPTTLEETSTRRSTGDPTSTSQATSTSHHGNGIEYAVKPPHGVDIQTLKTKGYFEYRGNAEGDGSDTQFHPLDVARPREPVVRRDREKPAESGSALLPATETPLPSRGSKPSAILGYFVTAAMKILGVLL